MSGSGKLFSCDFAVTAILRNLSLKTKVPDNNPRQSPVLPLGAVFALCV